MQEVPESTVCRVPPEGTRRRSYVHGMVPAGINNIIVGHTNLDDDHHHQFLPHHHHLCMILSTGGYFLCDDDILDPIKIGI